MRCRKCRKIVLSAITESGRKVTLDPDPARGGTMRIARYITPTKNRKARVPVWFSAHVVPPSRIKMYPGELYQSHACKEKPCLK